MTKNLLFATFLACIALPPALPSHYGVMADAQSAPAPGSARIQSAPSDSLTVVLLGTGVGPSVNLQQFGASILVEAGGERLLFDCGRGTTMRLTQAGVPIGSISRLFLTHLHSDHVIQIPDLFLTGWAGGRRTIPLEVWGPDGTSDMMDHIQQAFAFDIHMRRDVDEKLPAAGIQVVSHDIKQGIVFDERGVKVTAFLVDHGPVQPAFGYRIDYRGRSVALSGDTRVSENLIRFARGVDVLIHEVIDPDALRNRPDHPSAATIAAIIAHHTTPEQAGEVFSRVAPRLAVYSPAPNTENVMAQTRKTYGGPLQGPEDMLTILIGDKIEVRRSAR
ncbi:MAG: MBL fold metallo-hydrolase [Acidobacteriota bacterium]|nr:MBL fold metallo-hydrolase [Acidobacteriota bacterium]